VRPARFFSSPRSQSTSCKRLRRLRRTFPHIDGQLAYPQTGSAWTLPLREEELVVHKHSVQRGEVHIRRDVVVVKRTIEVRLETRGARYRAIRRSICRQRTARA
jgi:hypothetical protein